jgi:hypothetical protein
MAPDRSIRSTPSPLELDPDRDGIAIPDPLAVANRGLDGQAIRRGLVSLNGDVVQVVDPSEERTRSDPNDSCAWACRTPSSLASSAGESHEVPAALAGVAQHTSAVTS